jgi:spore maturation protein CgeB
MTMLLCIGNPRPGGTLWYLLKAFKKLRFECKIIDYTGYPRWVTFGEISIPLGKITSVSEIIKKSNFEPDIVIQFDGGPRALKGYEKLDVHTVFYSGDPHFLFSFHRNLIRKFKFDYVFTTQKKYLDEFKKINENTYFLPFAADPEIHKKYDVPKVFDIGFAGRQDQKLYSDRVRLLKYLSGNYEVLNVQGMHYAKMTKVYSLSKIGFNKSVRGDLNMRVFEIMSCGTMLLTDKIDNGVNDLFVNKKHLVMYENEEELNELVQYYLGNEEEREKIARKGQKEVHEKHTYEHRAEQILKTVKI